MFIPRGYLTLAAAINRQISARAPHAVEALEKALDVRPMPDRIAHLVKQEKEAAAPFLPASLATVGPLPRRLSKPPPLTADELAELSVWKAAEAERISRLYAAQSGIHLIRQQLILEIRQALAEKDLIAEVIRKDGELQTIPSALWRTDTGADAMRKGKVLHLGDPFRARLIGDVLINEGSFSAWVLQMTKADSSETGQTIAAERRLTAWLVAQMKTAPLVPVAKAEMKVRAATASHIFSDNGFDRAWAAAVQESGATLWSAKGRRRKSAR